MTRSLAIALLLAVPSLSYDELLPLYPVGNQLGMDDFGADVALCGNFAVVGAPSDDAKGAVYVFDIEQRRQIWKFSAADLASYDRFGLAVEIQGDRIAVGAPNQGAGAVYLYDLPTRSLVHKLVPDDLTTPDDFGAALWIDGSRVYVGAPQDDDGAPDAGAVYVFDLQTGAQLHKWTASDAGPSDEFGYSLALQGDRLLVGSLDEDAGWNAGSAYLLDVNTGLEVAKLLPPSVKSGDFFGWSATFAGSDVFVGAPGKFAQDKGQVFVFDPATGAQQGKFVASQAEAEWEFGHALAGNDRLLVVGAPGATPSDGHMVLIDPVTWTEVANFPNPSYWVDAWGKALDVDGQRVLIGSVHDPGDPVDMVWVAYLDELPSIGAPVCAPAVANSTGQPGLLEANGAVEVDLDCVTMTATQLPAGQLAMLLNGRDQGLSTPPGSQGTLCIAGPMGRYVDQLQLGGGAVEFVLDLAHTPIPGGEVAIQAGETWTFQCWYRDVNPGATSNFTNAVELRFE